MTRQQRERLALQAWDASDPELQAWISREANTLRRMKAERAPDIRGQVDRVTVLAGVWMRRHGKAMVDGSLFVGLDPAGELWIRDVGPVAARTLVEAGKAVGVAGRATPGGTGGQEERRDAFARRLAPVLGAAEAIAARGDELSSVALSEATGLTREEVRIVIRRARDYGQWPGHLVLARKPRRVDYSKLIPDLAPRRNAPAPAPANRWGSPPPAREAAPLAEGEAWVSLAPDYPDYEGTISGRLRRASTGYEPSCSPDSGGYKCHNAAGKPTTVTRGGVARRVAAATGQPIPEGVLKKRGRPKGRKKPDLDHIDFTAA